ncbi:MAG: hypothetical protein EOS27_04705 [Mesorhizobium sp.]|nr:MAG: hypothetical protein EOS27_04705 [Mesorhizobium sp.]TIX26221.1 MAG: hypothetical protein E5V35_11340 [Mesorhizobium sp.]
MGRPEIFIKFLFLSMPPRLEPLWRSGPYSPSRKASGTTAKSGGPFSGYCAHFNRWREVQAVQGTSVMDVIVLGIGVLFFVLFFAYVKACDRI